LAITIGPYAGVISITILLLIQALLFGDGGITTFGANVWNMGVIGVFIPYLLFMLTRRVVSGRSGLLAGAFVGAFAGDLLAAVFAGLELGFSALYFPYSVPIAVTAMAVHHAIIGIGEGIATTIILSALLRTRPELLQLPKVEPVWFGGLAR
jgi:cobalt/nickel transport system permease protein